MKDIRLIIADIDTRFIRDAGRVLEKYPNIHIVGHCGDGYELLEMINELKPDAVLTGLVLRQRDAISVMKTVCHSPGAPVFIICTDFCNELCIRRACRFGASAFLCKPVCPETLTDTIVYCCSEKRGGISDVSELDDLEDAAVKSGDVSDMLVKIGIAQDSEGFRYLKDAVDVVRRRPEAISSMTKLLYPEIARLNNTTPACAERNIRTAIMKAYTGAGFSINGHRPTNREMIAYLAGIETA